MKLKFSLPKISDARKRKLSKTNSSTYLHEDDSAVVLSLAKAAGVGESEALRVIVSDWISSQRVKAMGRDQVEDPIRRIYERVVEERINPLAELVRQIKGSVEKLASGQPAPQMRELLPAAGQDNGGEILSAINGLRSLIEQTGSDLSESSAAQISQLDTIQAAVLGLHGITSETFASSWTIADLIARYLVEVSLRDQNLLPEEVESEATKERALLRLEGLMKIAGLGRLLELPKEFLLAESVLLQKFSPVNGQTTVY